MVVHVAQRPSLLLILLLVVDFICLGDVARRGTSLSLNQTRRLATNLALLLFILLLTIGLVGCGGESGGENKGGSESERSTLTIFAASSLTDAFGDLESAFEE